MRQQPVAPAAPQVQAVSLNISACGTFAQLRNYLREIESMKRVAAVSNVSISRGSCARGLCRGRPDRGHHRHTSSPSPTPTPYSTEADADSTEATKGDSNE